MSREDARGRPATPALAVLDRAGIAYRVLAFDHEAPRSETTRQRFGVQAAEALDLDERAVLKSLVASVDGELIFALVSVADRLDAKALAREVGAKRAKMAGPDEAERATGYVVGGISALGSRTPLPIVADDRMVEFDEVFLSAGRRGVDVALAPADLLRVSGARLARIRVAP